MRVGQLRGSCQICQFPAGFARKNFWSPFPLSLVPFASIVGCSRQKLCLWVIYREAISLNLCVIPLSPRRHLPFTLHPPLLDTRRSIPASVSRVMATSLSLNTLRCASPRAACFIPSRPRPKVGKFTRAPMPPVNKTSGASRRSPLKQKASMRRKAARRRSQWQGGAR